jgi:hypothetical protein
MCTVLYLLPPGVDPIAVNKLSYIYISLIIMQFLDYVIRFGFLTIFITLLRSSYSTILCFPKAAESCTAALGSPYCYGIQTILHYVHKHLSVCIAAHQPKAQRQYLLKGRGQSYDTDVHVWIILKHIFKKREAKCDCTDNVRYSGEFQAVFQRCDGLSGCIKGGKCLTSSREPVRTRLVPRSAHACCITKYPLTYPVMS